MATGLNRDPIVILRMDGEDLLDFISSPAFEPEMASIISEMELLDGSIRDCILRALKKLTVVHGMPPSSDSWVMNNVVEPALQLSAAHAHEQPFSQETFLADLKNAAASIAQRLKEQPVIVAHCENTFDGGAISNLLSHQSELEKALDAAMAAVPREEDGKVPAEYLRSALDAVAVSAGLPPLSSIVLLEGVVEEALMAAVAGGERAFEEDEFRKTTTEILGGVMVRLAGDPVSVSCNSVVHESLASSSSSALPAALL